MYTKASYTEQLIRDGVDALEELLDQIGALTNKSDLVNFFGDEERANKVMAVREAMKAALDTKPPLATRYELRRAVEPILTIARKYRDNGLDEHRPEWGYRPLNEVELLQGRGGATLLTLEHVMEIERCFVNDR